MAASLGEKIVEDGEGPWRCIRLRQKAHFACTVACCPLTARKRGFLLRYRSHRHLLHLNLTTTRLSISLHITCSHSLSSSQQYDSASRSSHPASLHVSLFSPFILLPASMSRVATMLPRRRADLAVVVSLEATRAMCWYLELAWGWENTLRGSEG